MRLITHNLLKCNVKNLQANEGYPLKITAETTEIIPTEFNKDLVVNLFPKINLPALKSAINDLKLESTILSIDSFDGQQDNLEFLQHLHHILFEYHIIDGTLTCPTSGRKFPIKEGIPNMLLHEDEI